MCHWGRTKRIGIKIPANVSCTGIARWKLAAIDGCLADIVWALQLAGLETAGSCCGHGRYPAGILLSDGRVLQIIPALPI